MERATTLSTPEAPEFGASMRTRGRRPESAPRSSTERKSRTVDCIESERLLEPESETGEAFGRRAHPTSRARSGLLGTLIGASGTDVARAGSNPPTRLEQLEAALAGRNQFPLSRVREFERLPVRALVAAKANTESVREHLEQNAQLPVDLQLFSCDHEWRRIARELNGLHLRRHAFAAQAKHLVLTAYCEYLRSRESLFGWLISRRRSVANGFVASR